MESWYVCFSQIKTFTWIRVWQHLNQVLVSCILWNFCDVRSTDFSSWTCKINPQTEGSKLNHLCKGAFLSYFICNKTGYDLNCLNILWCTFIFHVLWGVSVCFSKRLSDLTKFSKYIISNENVQFKICF